MAVLGFEGSLTVGGVNPGFTNLRIGQSHTEVDSTTNLDEGNKSYVKGLMDKYIGADMNLDDSTACQTILGYVAGREPVQVSATMGNVTISGTMHIFGAEISSPLDDVPKMSITCRPAPASDSESNQV